MKTLGHPSIGALGTCVGFLIVVLAASPATTTEIPGEEIVQGLREGGYNVYFRHAPTNWDQGDRVRSKDDLVSCNPEEMRQLSDPGRRMARRLGKALRTLEIPVGEVISSPYCRTVETARLMDLGEVKPTRRIMNMRAAALFGGREAVIRRARGVLSDTPPTGTNRVIVGHGNLMRAATDAYAGEGGSGIYRPKSDSEPGFVLVARMSPDEWFRLAKRYSREGDDTN